MLCYEGAPRGREQSSGRRDGPGVACLTAKTVVDNNGGKSCLERFLKCLVIKTKCFDPKY